MTPEWSRPERLDAIGSAERHVAITADEAERAALARRFALLGVERLEAAIAVRQEAHGIVARGRVRGRVVQACVATGEPVTAEIDEPIDLLFVEAPQGDEAEVELSAGALDTVEIEGGAIDLGEAAAETLALALDPFPRSPEAAAALRKAGVLGEDEAGPTGALAGLKALLDGR